MFETDRHSVGKKSRQLRWHSWSSLFTTSNYNFSKVTFENLVLENSLISSVMKSHAIRIKKKMLCLHRTWQQCHCIFVTSGFESVALIGDRHPLQRLWELAERMAMIALGLLLSHACRQCALVIVLLPTATTQTGTPSAGHVDRYGDRGRD